MEYRKETGWGWIIFWLIIFWPVGLFMVIKKLSTDKSALMSGKVGTVSTIGWILVGIGTINLLLNFSDTSSVLSIMIALVLITGGVLLLRKASKTKKMAVRYKKYLDIVVNQTERSIDNVAAAVAKSYDIVEKDLQDMIDIGYLKDAYIHKGNREIILKQQVFYQAPPQNTVYNQVPAQTKSVRCPGCGANNVVTAGKVSECEYCGTPISG